MNAQSWKRLEALTEKCSERLRDPQVRSVTVWRGEMWAIIGAHHEIQKARAKAAKGKGNRRAHGKD